VSKINDRFAKMDKSKLDDLAVALLNKSNASIIGEVYLRAVDGKVKDFEKYLTRFKEYPMRISEIPEIITEDIEDENEIRKQNEEYLLHKYRVVAKPHEVKVLELYLQGYNSGRKLAKKIGVSHYSANLLIKKMKSCLESLN